LSGFFFRPDPAGQALEIPPLTTDYLPLIESLGALALGGVLFLSWLIRMSVRPHLHRGRDRVPFRAHRRRG